VGIGLLAFFLTGLVRRYALNRLVDIPNDRSSHHAPTPRGGGLAIVAAFSGGCLLARTAGWITPELSIGLLSGLLIAAIGFWDDHGHVPARYRMGTHIAAASLALAGLGGFSELPLGTTTLTLGWIGAGCALLWLVWLLNLFNFMDGIDGIAGAEVIFVTVAAAILSYWRQGHLESAGVCGLLLASATLGFLIWNWPPAKIFMGDVGSGFVGYTLGLLALVDMKANDGGLGLPAWVILDGLFLVDATYTLLRRMGSG
jgi:Fuc2NAc and GlcNAc transferase